jgi:hypothetical protein
VRILSNRDNGALVAAGGEHYPRNHASWRFTYSHVMLVRGIGVGTQMQKAALGLVMFTADANMYMCTIHNSCT